MTLAPFMEACMRNRDEAFPSAVKAPRRPAMNAASRVRPPSSGALADAGRVASVRRISTRELGDAKVRSAASERDETVAGSAVPNVTLATATAASARPAVASSVSERPWAATMEALGEALEADRRLRNATCA